MKVNGNASVSSPPSLEQLSRWANKYFIQYPQIPSGSLTLRTEKPQRLRKNTAQNLNLPISMCKWKLYYLPFGLGVWVGCLVLVFFFWLVGFFKAYSAVTEDVDALVTGCRAMN